MAADILRREPGCGLGWWATRSRQLVSCASEFDSFCLRLHSVSWSEHRSENLELGYPFLTVLIFALFKAGSVSGTIGEVIGTLLGEVSGAASSESARRFWDHLRNKAPGDGADELQRAVSRSFLSALLQAIRAYADQHKISVQASDVRDYVQAWGPFDMVQIRREEWVQRSAEKLTCMRDGPLPEFADLLLPEPDQLFRSGSVTAELTERVWEWMSRQVPDPPVGFRAVFDQLWFPALQDAFRLEIQGGGKPALMFIATGVSELRQLGEEHSRKLDKVIDSLPPLKRNGKPVPSPDSSGYMRRLHDQTQWIVFKGPKEARQLATGLASMPPLYPTRAQVAHTSDPGDPSIDSRKPPPIRETLAPRTIVILGGAGSGKSTLMRRIAWELCRDDPPTMDLPFQGAFPILIPVSSLDEHIRECLKRRSRTAPTEQSDPEWIPHYLAEKNHDLGRKFFDDKLGDADTVVLVDGLDEATNSSRLEMTVKLLERARVSFPCRLLVTTRPEVHQAEAALSPDFHRVQIGELDDELVRQFLLRWSECLHDGNADAAKEYADALAGELQARPDIQTMTRNPLMLTTIALVFHGNSRRLPDQPAELYEEVLTWLAKQRKWRQGRPAWDECLNVLGHLALRMQGMPGEGQTLKVGLATAADWISEHTHFRDGRDRRDAARKFLLAEEADSGIIRRAEALLSFEPRRFQEYLAARALAGLPPEQIRQRLFGNSDANGHVYTPHWRDSLELLAGYALRYQGPENIHWLVEEILGHAAGRPLEECVRAYGVLGAILIGLPDEKYAMQATMAERFKDVGRSLMAIFDLGAHRTIGIRDRIAAADALALAGDPRLLTPDRPGYWVEIPAGRGWVGSTKEDKRSPVYDPDRRDWEMEPKQVHVKRPFQIGRFPVTVYEYQHYLESPDVKRESPADWGEQVKHPSRPVVWISREDAEAYCAYYHCKLPDEQQWEYAARGGGEKPRRYPWGDQPPDDMLLNFNNSVGHPTPVGLFPEGNTPEGVCDMAGNVWERTTTPQWKGASSWNDAQWVRSAYRSGSDFDWVINSGFRCVRE